MAAARAFGRPPVRSSGAPLMMLSNAGRAGPLDSMEQRLRLPVRSRSGGNGGALWRQHLRFSTGTSGLCVRIAADDGRWIWSSPGRSGQGMKPYAWCPHRKSDRGRTSPFRGEGRTVWIGASRPLRRIPTIVSFLNPQPALSLVGGNRSSCPLTDLRISRADPRALRQTCHSADERSVRR